MNIPSQLEQCFSAVFTELDEAAIAQASVVSVQEWDSVASVTLVAVVEEEFGIDVAPEDLDKFVSFSSILAYLKQQPNLSDSSAGEN